MHGGSRPGAGRKSALEAAYRRGVEDLMAELHVAETALAIARRRGLVLLANPATDPSVAQLRALRAKENGALTVNQSAA